jgi:hypothetical protein
MHVFLIVICYLAAALALVSVGVIGVSMLRSPVETTASDAQRPKLVRRADRNNPGEQQPTDAPRAGAAFRYGPEINHGRSDTPVNYAQQALKEARSASASLPTPVRLYRQYQERRIVDHGVRPSGH